uniref:Uncharacterized protein n=1 Tax=Ditylenchus dipsaci TaxID=166011 RepID=A0A915CLE0_9BILA
MVVMELVNVFSNSLMVLEDTILLEPDDSDFLTVLTLSSKTNLCASLNLGFDSNLDVTKSSTASTSTASTTSRLPGPTTSSLSWFTIATTFGSRSSELPSPSFPPAPPPPLGFESSAL